MTHRSLQCSTDSSELSHNHFMSLHVNVTLSNLLTTQASKQAGTVHVTKRKPASKATNRNGTRSAGKSDHDRLGVMPGKNSQWQLHTHMYIDVSYGLCRPDIDTYIRILNWADTVLDLQRYTFSSLFQTYVHTSEEEL